VRHSGEGVKNLPTFEKSLGSFDEAKTHALDISKAHPDDLITVESAGGFEAIFWHGDSISSYL
jgi:hypothetical protein